MNINTVLHCINVYFEFVIVGFNLYESWFKGCEMFLYWISWVAVGIEFCFAVLAVGKRNCCSINRIVLCSLQRLGCTIWRSW